MDVDTSNWSGEGEFTQVLVDQLKRLPILVFLRVEDAPATRSEADFNFVSNEVYVAFATEQRIERGRRWGVLPTAKTIEHPSATLADLETALTALAEIGPPDYSDAGMLQYLRSERIIPPYQTRGYKLVELVRIYEAGKERR